MLEVFSSAYVIKYRIYTSGNYTVEAERVHDRMVLGTQ